jgi:DNA-binding CsgD family transcriptional regulator
VIAGVIERVPTTKRLTDMEMLVAILLGLNKSYADVARELQIEPSTVRTHADRAAAKIPGDLPSQARVVVWVRGATRDVLEGRSLAYEIVTRGKGPASPRRQRRPHSADGAQASAS